METRPDHPTIQPAPADGPYMVSSCCWSALPSSRWWRPDVRQPGPAGIAGWVVVERSPIGDDTATIQAAIDSVAWSQASTATRVSPDVSTFT